ncbi:hypothetical protein ACETIH_11490 [Microvirga arabica]|uniref:Uncharacterized protein n=1 Tax=Microvirga arabica TaxID=1128671 RepID=A0ABV6Y7T3_9HYPH
MSDITHEALVQIRANPIRAPQNVAGGLVLVALAALALWLTRDLDQGTLNSMGPAMLPRWLAVAVGLSGLALLAATRTRRSKEKLWVMIHLLFAEGNHISAQTETS